MRHLLANSPLNLRCSLNAGLRVSATKIHPLTGKAPLWGPQAPVPATIKDRKVHAGFSHECTQTCAQGQGCREHGQREQRRQWRCVGRIRPCSEG